jgi:hypothetical protein
LLAGQPGFDHRCLSLLVGGGSGRGRGRAAGSLVSRFVSRRIILAAVALLCLFQYCWTCCHEHLVGRALVVAALGGIGLNMALHVLFIFGRRSLPLKG